MRKDTARVFYVQINNFETTQERIQEFWLGVDFFFPKAWGSRAALRPQVGPGQRPGGGQEAKPTEAHEF